LENLGKDFYLRESGMIPISNYLTKNNTPRCQIFLTKERFLKTYCVSFGYESRGLNSEAINLGDCLTLLIGTKNLSISMDFELTDQSRLFNLYDSPSFSLAISGTKSFNLSKDNQFKIILNQTFLGRDTDLETSLSLITLLNH